MIVFLDTEFTELVHEPRLLSVGMVNNELQISEFYAEVTDADRLSEASFFTRDTVLPQFGKVPDAACTHFELGARVSAYLKSLVERLAMNQQLVVAFECHLDWELLVLAMEDGAKDSCAELLQRICPTNIFNLAGFEAGKATAESYFQKQRHAAIARHHALCDARALRIAYLAALASRIVVSPPQVASTRREWSLRAGAPTYQALGR
jgi:hypothetical protein